MEPGPERLIDIDELARRSGRRLEDLGVAQANGQVTALPDSRTLRWYTTVGLLDRPIERRGRRAFYGRHHVAQVVAVKRLQAEGASLTDIATRLAGLSTVALEALAAGPGRSRPASVSSGSGDAGPLGPQAKEPVPSGSGDVGDFWSAAPVSRSIGVPGVLAGVALDPTTSVTFAAPRPLTDADVDSLRRAATPLLDELRRRGLVPVPMHLTDLPKDHQS